MSPKLDFRRLDRSYLQVVSDLHQKYFRYRTKECLEWQLFDDDLPSEGIVVGAFDGSKLVGTQAFIPVKSWCNNSRELLASKAELALLLPEYRGSYIFKELFDVGMEFCEQEGIECIFGFTTATKVFHSLGFHILCPWYVELLVLNPARFLKSLLNIRRGWTPPPAAAPPSVPEALQNTKDGTFGLRRDGQYIRHWYVNNPYRTIIYFDQENGVLYTVGRSRPFVFVSEITRYELLQSSVRQSVKGRRRQWVSLCRKTNHPAFNWRTITGAMHIVKHRGSLIFRWIGSFKGHSAPSMFTEEGYGEGIL